MGENEIKREGMGLEWRKGGTGSSRLELERMEHDRKTEWVDKASGGSV